jgi:hypothetical protein
VGLGLWVAGRSFRVQRYSGSLPTPSSSRRVTYCHFILGAAGCCRSVRKLRVPPRTMSSLSLACAAPRLATSYHSRHAWTRKTAPCCTALAVRGALRCAPSRQCSLGVSIAQRGVLRGAQLLVQPRARLLKQSQTRSGLVRPRFALVIGCSGPNQEYFAACLHSLFKRRSSASARQRRL